MSDLGVGVSVFFRDFISRHFEPRMWLSKRPCWLVWIILLWHFKKEWLGVGKVCVRAILVRDSIKEENNLHKFYENSDSYMFTMVWECLIRILEGFLDGAWPSSVLRRMIWDPWWGYVAVHAWSWWWRGCYDDLAWIEEELKLCKLLQCSRNNKTVRKSISSSDWLG